MPHWALCLVFYYIFCIFNLDFFRALILQKCIGSMYLARATPPTYTVDPIYRGAWGPSSATAIYPDRDISWGGSLLRRR